MVGGQVPQPPHRIAVEQRLLLAIGAPEPPQLAEGVEGRRRADAVNKLVAVDKHEGGGGLGHLAAAHPGPPAHIAAQLAVGHHLVGGEVALELHRVGNVVLHVGQQATLFHKQLRRRNPLAGRRTDNVADPMVGRWEKRRHLRARHDDGLVSIDARRRAADGLQGTRRLPGLRPLETFEPRVVLELLDDRPGVQTVRSHGRTSSLACD